MATLGKFYALPPTAVITTVDSVADLRNEPLDARKMVETRGYATIGDGGGAQFVQATAGPGQVSGGISINIFTISTLTSAAGIATAVTSAAHKFLNGQQVTVQGAVQPEYNGVFTITYINPFSFSYSISGAPASPATGTITTVAYNETATVLLSNNIYKTGDTVVISGASPSYYNGQFSVLGGTLDRFFIVVTGAIVQATGTITVTQNYVDNGGTVIVPTGGAGNEAWVMIPTGSVSILQFGADPSGQSDSTTAIQAALDCGVGDVFIPQGVFNITNITLNHRNTRLRGASTRLSVLSQTGGGTAITCYDPFIAWDPGPWPLSPYIDSGWFFFENFQLFVENIANAVAFDVGNTRSSFTHWRDMSINIVYSVLAPTPAPGTVGIRCDNTPWEPEDATYISKIEQTYIRGFETTVLLKSVVNGWVMDHVYVIASINNIVLDNISVFMVKSCYFETDMINPRGIIFGPSGGAVSFVSVIGCTFEFTNPAPTPWAYDFSSGATVENFYVENTKYLINGDGNAINNRRYIGTPPRTYVELARTYLSSILGTLPMLWAPGVTSASRFVLPNYSKFGGFQQGNGKIFLARGDTDAVESVLEQDSAFTFILRSGGGGFDWTDNAAPTPNLLLQFDPFSLWFGPGADGTQNLGDAAFRWNTIHATNNVINTSDEKDKTDIRSLEEKELAVAKRLKKLIKVFRMRDAVAKKGENARLHVGAIAQEVEQAFTAEGLDGFRYGVLCYDKWEKTEKTEAGSRFGLRYDQFLAFIIAAL